ncbi:MAG: type II toxin-antitoxin system PemK/MazF family toxin [Proteobacteria bacterium]|nr:type II toxin-antitoxin system PemK/MazF family toxin [Pseudomonadota bacterium]
MAKRVGRGEIWLHRFAPPDRRRPVVVVSRQALLDVIHTATVVAITSSVRGSPTEVVLGVDEGLKKPSCANAVNVFTVRQSDLRQFVGLVPPPRMRDLCRALAIACGCED